MYNIIKDRGRSRKKFEGGSRVNILYNEGNPLKKHTALKICKGKSGHKGGGGVRTPWTPPPLRQPLKGIAGIYLLADHYISLHDFTCV